uniref:ARMC5-like ARM-repeats domain-containing protein n=2 Tax=Cacopsylla melanoneura TaxID=428564 RepID=A0A8D8SIS2_9HEMI
MASNEVKTTLQLLNNITQTANVELKIQSLAKIKSSLTTNNEHLKIFKQLCGFKHLCGLLKDNTNVKVVNLVLSILANSAMNEDVRREIVVEHHVLQYVFSTLEYIENPALHCRAIRLVANVSRTSAYSKYVMRFPFLPKIVGVLTSTSSSDSIITCIRAIKYLWLWDQYRINNELMSLNAIKHILDKLTLLSNKPALILSHLQMIQTMLGVNTKAFISCMSYLHYEWMVNLLRQENGQYDAVLVQILLKLSVYSKTHFELAKTSLLERIISLIWPHNARDTRQTYLLIRIIAALCKENLFRQKIIQTPHAIQALLTYLNMDSIDDIEEMRDVIMDDDAQSSSTKSTRSSFKPSDQCSSVNNLTNSIHYYILMAINHYQYDHDGLYRFLRANLIPILMKRLKGQIDQYEYKHSSPVCDESKYLSSKQSLNTSGNMSPLSPNYSSGNFSPTNSSSPPRYMSPVNPWSPLWNASTSTATAAPGFDLGFDSTNEAEEEMKERCDNDDDDDDRSVYSPLIEFSDEDATMSNHGDEDTQTDAASSVLGSTDSQEERLDVHIIRIMLHISYMKTLFDHLSLKQTWSTLIEYLVKVQQDDCCRNVYKILLIICKNRAFLRSLLVDNFILHVHKKLIRTKHGTPCMICNNVMIYGQGIINEISNETNSHYGYEEIMIQYRHQDQQQQQQQPRAKKIKTEKGEEKSADKSVGGISEKNLVRSEKEVHGKGKNIRNEPKDAANDKDNNTGKTKTTAVPSVDYSKVNFNKYMAKPNMNSGLNQNGKRPKGGKGGGGKPNKKKKR